MSVAGLSVQNYPFQYEHISNSDQVATLKLESSLSTGSQPFSVSISIEAKQLSIEIQNKVQTIEKVNTDADFILTDYELLDLFEVFWNLEGPQSFEFVNTLLSLPSKDQENFLGINAFTEESIDAFLELTNTLPEKDRSLFLSIGAKTSDGFNDLMRVTQKLSGEAR
ncbi:MAG: hypothetical protein GY857_17330, partial [Desulfobacula sp.]|nr:hypothetical protein [Desulfobacula sp.]